MWNQTLKWWWEQSMDLDVARASASLDTCVAANENDDD